MDLQHSSIDMVRSLADVTASEWDARTPANTPFTDHAYLAALETSASVGGRSGWHPHYLMAKNGNDVVGASFLYTKTNSHGEYIFDWGWADAYRRYDVPYYPKLTSSVPFTPATGPKLLLAPGADRDKTSAQLIAAGKALMTAEGHSSLHYLFIAPEEIAAFEAAGFMIRDSFQYHWTNHSYTSFADFLGALKSKKRRQIEKERRELQGEGLTIRHLSGADLRSEHADIFYAFYRSTIEKRRGIPYLTLAFFRTVFETMRDDIILILAEEQTVPIAGALFYQKGDALFGRYWGCSKDVRHLHFELCYYQPIELAIQRQLRLFEAGAQGEHKIARGFTPVLTFSAHWLQHAAFREAIGHFIAEERTEIQALFASFAEHSPYA